MKFDLILTNPPFQDTVNRNKTPHKLWIDFTLAVFDRFLREGGSLVQVSPSSFSSPSSLVLALMKENRTRVLRLSTERHFPDVASTFSDYWIEKTRSDGATRVIRGDEDFALDLSDALLYLPADLGRISMSIHAKVMFAERDRLPVQWDYVSAHNSLRKGENPTLAEQQSPLHPYPVFHTNRSTWWSSVRQEWAGAKKVLWTRSGYMKPFYDDGVHGGSDMTYYVLVASEEEGLVLAANLNTELMRYVYASAKWSGFGDPRVFTALPDLPCERALSEDEMYALFSLTEEEVAYVRAALAPRRSKAL